eukprot:jgi/Bigna1/81726/fgenesh1_pg.83_\
MPGESTRPTPLSASTTTGMQGEEDDSDDIPLKVLKDKIIPKDTDPPPSTSTPAATADSPPIPTASSNPNPTTTTATTTTTNNTTPSNPLEAKKPSSDSSDDESSDDSDSDAEAPLTALGRTAIAASAPRRGKRRKRVVRKPSRGGISQVASSSRGSSSSKRRKTTRSSSNVAMALAAAKKKLGQANSAAEDKKTKASSAAGVAASAAKAKTVAQNDSDDATDEEEGKGSNDAKHKTAARTGMLGFNSTIMKGLKKLSRDDILVKLLHRLLFGSVGQRARRKHEIQAFSFFNPGDVGAKQNLVSSLSTSKWTAEILRQLARVFGVSSRGTKAEIADRCGSFLIGRHVEMGSEEPAGRKTGGRRQRNSSANADRAKGSKNKGGKKRKRLVSFSALGSKPQSLDFYKPYLRQLSQQQLQDIIRNFSVTARKLTAEALRNEIIEMGGASSAAAGFSTENLDQWVWVSEDGVNFEPATSEPQEDHY